MVDDD